MKHDAINFVKNGNFGFRMSNPEIDFNRDGYPVEKNYVSFVKISDCRLYQKRGRTYYDASEAPSIPVNHGGTYYGYGEWKKRKSNVGKWLRDNNNQMYWVDEYWQCTVYLAKDGFVYTSSLKRIKKP